MASQRQNPNKPAVAKEHIGDLTSWDVDMNKDNIPYISHAPENPVKMTSDRKKRIRKILDLKEKEPGISPREIAEKLNLDTKTVKRDLVAAMILVKENKPYLRPRDKELMMKTVSTYSDEAKNLFARIKVVIGELETQKTYLDPKAAISFAMLLGELRQTIELGAKLTGELQTGTKVNVIMFSGLVKRIIEIINQEVDRATFMRIRERLKLEMQGQSPLGDKGGNVEIINDGQTDN